MTKSAKLNSEVSDTLRYQYAELAFRGTISVGVDLGDNQLNVYRQDLGHSVVVNEAPISPKKLRKFARALLALADQVDPPAPVIEYFQSTNCPSIFWRAQPGLRPEVLCFEGRWERSPSYASVIDLREKKSAKSITPDALPQDARPA